MRAAVNLFARIANHNQGTAPHTLYLARVVPNSLRRQRGGVAGGVELEEVWSRLASPQVAPQAASRWGSWDLRHRKWRRSGVELGEVGRDFRQRKWR
ncbi:MAG TPA: hypothetical protein VER33_23140 [Polyangiaceae bacterium]|nr:hypothetical protein [Polyangiaceae bacterium]